MSGGQRTAILEAETDCSCLPPGRTCYSSPVPQPERRSHAQQAPTEHWRSVESTARPCTGDHRSGETVTGSGYRPYALARKGRSSCGAVCNQQTEPGTDTADSLKTETKGRKSWPVKNWPAALLAGKARKRVALQQPRRWGNVSAILQSSPSGTSAIGVMLGSRSRAATFECVPPNTVGSPASTTALVFVPGSSVEGDGFSRKSISCPLQKSDRYFRSNQAPRRSTPVGRR